MRGRNLVSSFLIYFSQNFISPLDCGRQPRYNRAVRPVTPSSDRRPLKRTIHEVARRARVSTSTVSRTINSPSLVDAETAQRVWKAIEEATP